MLMIAVETEYVRIQGATVMSSECDGLSVALLLKPLQFAFSRHEGEHCEDINLDGYCRLSLNGFECVPGLQYLGIGFDITTGQYTERLRALDFRVSSISKEPGAISIICC